MSWKHMLLEVYCSYEKEEIDLPKCCKKGPNQMGPHCSEYRINDTKNFCPYLSFTPARSTVALTNQEGEVVAFNSFYGELDMKEEAWLKEEEKWLANWKTRILIDPES